MLIKIIQSAISVVQDCLNNSSRYLQITVSAIFNFLELIFLQMTSSKLLFLEFC